MVSMRNWMLGAAVAAGTLGLAAAPAQAAEFGVYVRGPVVRYDRGRVFDRHFDRGYARNRR